MMFSRAIAPSAAYADAPCCVPRGRAVPRDILVHEAARRLMLLSLFDAARCAAVAPRCCRHDAYTYFRDELIKRAEMSC